MAGRPWHDAVMHRRTRLVAAPLAAIVLGLTACGGDDDDADTTPVTDAADTTTASVSAAPTVTQQPAPTDAPTTTEAPTTTVAGPIVIEVDGDAASPVEQAVALGSEVEIVVTSAEEQEFHLHGYDLEQEGTRVTFVLTATQAGTFELERHRDGGVVLLLTVA
jgi:hypothetical protein